MNILNSPMLPETNGTDHTGAAKYPPFKGGQDERIVEQFDAHINGDRRPRMMSKWAILAYVRAIRDLFPEEDFDTARDQSAIARKVGYTSSGSALSMGRKVMDALNALNKQEELA